MDKFTFVNLQLVPKMRILETLSGSLCRSPFVECQQSDRFVRQGDSTKGLDKGRITYLWDSFYAACLWMFSVVFCAAVAVSGRAADTFGFSQEKGHIAITLDDKPLATYVFRDPKIYRPYFAHVHAPTGPQVTRSHPPVEGQDSTDHAGLHPGIWMAFADINDTDFWRNKAIVEHEKFLEAPAASNGKFTFAVVNRYFGPARRLICTETSHYTLLRRPQGCLLTWDSVFQNAEGEVTFGDEEEMGLGVRVNSAITVKNGGSIVDSSGGKNEAGTRGRIPDWIDYSGTIEGERAGVCLMADPANRQKSWAHTRDYGLMVLNPFGGRSVAGGASSMLRLSPGQTLKLRYGVLLHGPSAPADLKAAYSDFVGTK